MKQIITVCLLGIGTCVIGAVTANEIVETNQDYETFSLFLATLLSAVMFGAYSAYSYLRMMYGLVEDDDEEEEKDIIR